MRRAALLIVLLVATAAHAEPSLEPLPRTGRTRVIVEFRGGEPRATRDRFRRDLGALHSRVASQQAIRPAIRHEYANVLFGAAVDLPPEMLDSVRTLPYVRSVYEDRRVTKFSNSGSNDTAVVDAGVNVNSLALPAHGEGMRIGVIDTGIDYTHPALGGGFGPGYKVEGGWDFVNGDADPRDDEGHGTHVAGIIAAEAPGLLGVAPRATIYAYKVLDHTGTGTESDTIAAIERTVDPNGDGDFSDRLDVVNLSLGGPGSSDDPQSRAIDNATARGVVFCIAAGNTGAFAVIGSPGTALSAITVGATDVSGQLTAFSSRGPTPRDLHFKPDVVAPGLNITSTWPGGGTMVLSGTSMATPHVTGVCALLRRLHPDWTPAEVKAALTSTATAVDARPHERGAGRVDAQRANEATTFVSESGLSFGLDASSEPSWSSVRSFVVTNGAASPRAYTLSAPMLPEGMAIAVTPPSFTLEPGTSRRVDVRLTVDNTIVPMTAEPARGGEITLAADTQSIAIPWTVVRSGRMTVGLDAFWAAPLAWAENDDAIQLMPYAVDRAEAYVPSGGKWELTLAGLDREGVVSLIVLPDRVVSGDTLFQTTTADAPYTIALDTRDERGIPFTQKPGTHKIRLHLLRHDVRLSAELGSRTTFRVSAMPGYRYTPFESYVDLDAMEFYGVRHPELRDVASDVTLSPDASSYVSGSLIWKPRGPYDDTIQTCFGVYYRQVLDITPMRYDCAKRAADAPMRLRFVSTPDDRSDPYLWALALDGGSVHLPILRDYEGRVVASAENVPAPTAVRLDDRASMTLGDGPVHPFEFLGMFDSMHGSGYRGPLGEARPVEGMLSFWTLYDGTGAKLSSGRLTTIPTPLLTQPAGGRMLVTTDSILLDGDAAHGEIDVRFADSVDAPPAFTSMRVVDATGAIVDFLHRGSAAALEFSADDFGDGVPKPEATRVAYRVHGATDWLSVPVVMTASDVGDTHSLGHRPAGDLYRADLTPATALADTLIDLRVEIEDRAGNRVTWTQSPALVIGETAKKRRSVR